MVVISSPLEFLSKRHVSDKLLSRRPSRAWGQCIKEDQQIRGTFRPMAPINTCWLAGFRKGRRLCTLFWTRIYDRPLTKNGRHHPHPKEFAIRTGVRRLVGGARGGQMRSRWSQKLILGPVSFLLVATFLAPLNVCVRAVYRSHE